MVDELGRLPVRTGRRPRVVSRRLSPVGSTATGAPAHGVTDDRRLERLLAGWPDAFVEIDRAGTVIEWNAGAEVPFGWRRDEVLGRS